MTNYPDGLTNADFCHMEGHVGSPYCPSCGNTDYHHLGFLGAIGRWAKEWGVSKDEAFNRITGLDEQPVELEQGEQR